MCRTILSSVQIITISLGSCKKYTGRTGYSTQPGTPIGQQRSLGVIMALPESAVSLVLRKDSRVQGRRIGLERSATRYVGCFPFRRAAASSIKGYALSNVTGSGPLSGGR